MSYPTHKQISLDIYNNLIVCFNAKQGDTGSRYVEITCTENGKKIVIDSSYKAYVGYQKIDKTYGLNDAIVLPNGNLQVELTQHMLANPGKAQFDIILADAVGSLDVVNGKLIITDTTIISTMPFYVNVLASSVDHTVAESSNDFNALLNAMARNIELERICNENEENRKTAFEQNEKDRQTTFSTNEDERINAENVRKGNETTRQDNETERINSEINRIANEELRQNGEFGETYRIANEIKRQDDKTGESYRIANENIRISNETARGTTFSNKMTEWEEKVGAAIKDCEDAFETSKNGESTRQTNFENSMSSWGNDVDNVILDCREAIGDAISATEDANVATTNANNAATNAGDSATAANNAADRANNAASRASEAATSIGKATTDAQNALATANGLVSRCESISEAEEVRNETFNTQIASMNKVLEDINGATGVLINDEAIGVNTSYSSEKIVAYVSNLFANISNSNLLINGDFKVWQRGTNFDFTPNETNYNYTADRWCIYDGSNISVNKLDVGASLYSDGANKLTQMLEDRLAIGETYVLSAKIDGHIRTLDIVAGTPCSNDYLEYTIYISKNNITYDVIAIKPISNSTITIEWVKLEKGMIATPFVSKSYGKELSMCRRFYRRYYGSDIVTFTGVTGITYIKYELEDMRDDRFVTHNISAVSPYIDGKVEKTYKISSCDAYNNEVRITLENFPIKGMPVQLFWTTSEYLAIDAEIY